MKRLRWFLALPAMLIAMSGPSIAADIRDKADLFSAEAIKKAETELKRIEAEYKVPIQIETIPTLNGSKIDDAIRKIAKAEDAHGLFVLIAKKEKDIEVGESGSLAKYVTKSMTRSVRSAILAEFKKGDFDSGLRKGVDKIDSILSEARAEAGGSLKVTTPAGRRTNQVAPAGRPAVVGNPSGGSMVSLFLMIGLGLLAVFIVIRLLSALFSGGGGGYQQRPMGGGMGGPGYGGGGGGYGGGGGGGGFMSSLFGGIGGALAGNWLYDQFSGRHHDAGVGQTSSTYDQGTGAEAPANDDFVTPDDGGANWGDGGGDTGGGGGDWGGGDTGGGGGDWGGGGDGGGGGDWGGGGGGGDWGGGGGGGDWGGGGGGDGGW